MTDGFKVGDYWLTLAKRRPEESYRELLQSLERPEGFQTPQEDTEAHTGAQTKDLTLSCDTPCDTDCTAVCHEGHEWTFNRVHQPEECPGTLVKE